VSEKTFLTGFQKRIFFSSAVAMFVIMALHYLNITPTLFISPVPEKVDVLEMLRPKLEQHENTFSLKKHTSFVSRTHASAEYENARSYALIDMGTGEILEEKSLSEEVPIASLTKIMTAIVALDLASSDEYFTVTKHASEQIPTKIGVVPGERLRLEELIKAVMLTSANDAAQVISDGIDTKYGEKVFMRAMNEKAAFLGLSQTHFTNPQGFDNPEHYSSAEDLAVLTHYALTHYPLFADVFKKDYVFLPADAEHKQFDLYNWNGLLGVYPDVSGVKIGNTNDAGRTSLVVSKRGGKTLMVVLLGAPGILERDLWASQLLDRGFVDTLGLTPINVTEEALYEKYASWKYFKG
jgi:D-alanyl-D-alanine carboxypeptidase